jgi:hypothetical protein
MLSFGTPGRNPDSIGTLIISAHLELVEGHELSMTYNNPFANGRELLCDEA